MVRIMTNMRNLSVINFAILTTCILITVAVCYLGAEHFNHYLDVSGPMLNQATKLDVRNHSVTAQEASPTHTAEQVNITVFIDMIDKLDAYYGQMFSEMEQKSLTMCPLPNNSKCIYQHTNNTEADVIFRVVQFYLRVSMTDPLRFCERQIVAMLNSEAESPEMMEPLRDSDIRIDYHSSSTITRTPACSIPWSPDHYVTPDPSARKGVALLMSNCNVRWRNEYILEVAKHVHIYSYGKCLHNTAIPASSTKHAEYFPVITKKHRMVIAFENHINHTDYISDKLTLCFKSGVIPVYWGPPEIYQWLPGSHSIIDVSKFKGPKELAQYLKRVDEDDDLFRYHTTNFIYTPARKTHTENCSQKHYLCQICEIAQEMKIQRREQGLSPATCLL